MLQDADTKEVYEFGLFRLDGRLRTLTRDGEPVRLPPKAFNVLLALVVARGDFLSRDDLLKTVWADTHVRSPSVDFQIHVIRRALGRNAAGRDFVENVPGHGFRLIEDLKRLPRTLTETPAVSVAPAAERPPQTPKPRRGRQAAYAVTIVLVLSLALGLFALVGRSSGSLRIVESAALTHDREPKDLPLLSDGVRVYYLQPLDGAVLAVPLGGGEATPVFQPPNEFFLVDVNPGNGAYLAVRLTVPGEDGELWRLPMTSGIPRRIGDIRCEWATWSPDAQQIAFVRGGELYVARNDGTILRKLPAPHGGRFQLPRWSPDGLTLRFTISALGAAQAPSHSIWEVRADGAGLRRLLAGWNDPPDECCGSWTTDGAYFVFQSSRNGRSGLWALPERTGLFHTSQRPIELTVGPLRFRAPVVSRDGSRVFALGVNDEGELVRFDQASRAFVPYLGGLSATWISFSPDKNWITYVSYPEKKLWRAHLDGSAKQPLAIGPLDVDGAMWSPDGTQIAFLSHMGGAHMNIYLIPSTGGVPRRIIPEDKEQGVPTWSPDGARLAFGDVPDVFGTPTGQEVLHVYDVARRELSIVPDSHGLWTCRWSPDGRYLSALTIDARQRLRLFEFKTRTWRDLEADHIDNPSWSHDSKFIYYDTQGTGYFLRRVRVSDGKVDELANLEHYPVAAGWWSGLAPDDSPIILRNLGGTEVYALRLEAR